MVVQLLTATRILSYVSTAVKITFARSVLIPSVIIVEEAVVEAAVEVVVVEEGMTILNVTLCKLGNMSIQMIRMLLWSIMERNSISAFTVSVLPLTKLVSITGLTLPKIMVPKRDIQVSLQLQLLFRLLLPLPLLLLPQLRPGIYHLLRMKMNFIGISKESTVPKLRRMMRMRLLASNPLPLLPLLVVVVW
jgi:hypothetical protein|tara:strand:- start:790 stop:1362 length:573 start_codon:yes stop_codon:yes gene_type:complete